LGARIIEKEYKYFFRNLDLSGFFETTAGQKPVIMVKDKEQTNIESSTNSVEAVTGATQTSQGVLEMVNRNFAAYLKILQAYKEQA
jgi:Na+-transporting NADH:ubiquinone oxidoreductase subunit NqrC